MADRTIVSHAPDAPVQTDWLAAHLDDADLRIFDCTTHLLPADADTKPTGWPTGSSGAKRCCPMPCMPSASSV